MYDIILFTIQKLAYIKILIRFAVSGWDGSLVKFRFLKAQCP